MALRAVSIVSLESSIRTQFDRQIDSIQRDLENRERQRRELSDTPEDNDVISPEIAENITNSPTENQTSCLEMRTEMPLPGISRSPSVTVDYPDFPTSPDLPEHDDSDISDHEFEQPPSSNPRSMTCCQFYRNHWLGHLITGVLSGCLFVLLGIIFLAQSNDFPHYAGIVLILLGLAPCCMAVNRYRYIRLYEQERRRAMRRLGAIRRQHRRNRRESRRRRRQEYSDTPPSYDNLGFDSDEDHETPVDGNDNMTSASRRSSFVLPSYEEYMKKSSIYARASPKRPNHRTKQTPYVITIDESNTNNNAGPPDIRVTSHEENEIEIASHVTAPTFSTENTDSVSAPNGDINSVDNTSIGSNEDYTIL